MTVVQKLKHELRAVLNTSLYFGGWIALLVTLKQLILAEYDIAFSGIAMAVTGALVLSKVVLVLEHVPLGAWLRGAPAWADILVRTALYAGGLFLVLVLEKLIHELREGADGLTGALSALGASANIHHAVANAIGLTGALLVYNFFAVVRRHLAPHGLVDVLGRPVPEATVDDLP